MGEITIDDGVDAAQLVVIGSSAGGIEALSVLLGSLPAGFVAPVVIAQHLDPQRPSHLAEILGRRSALPVRTILGSDRLEAGIVYVVPADRNVQIVDGHLRLIQEPFNHRPRPSINMLFSTAAAIYGERLIAVILTGTGSDGAAGALEVKKAGGTVLAQNPQTALFPGMPLSLAPTTIDVIADLEQMGPLLTDLAMGTMVVTQRRETRALSTFLEYVHEHSGLDFTQYKTPTILRRLKRRMVATGASSLTHYIRYLQRDPAEYQRLVSSFLINVTEFFRDQPVFDALARNVLPSLIDYSRRHKTELRVWSAGCATGEEAYSVAIQLAELLGNSMEQLKVRVFATDIDADAIAFARRGVYSSAAVQAVPEHLVARYFVKHDGEYEIHKRVRSMVIFGEHDLGRRAPFPHIDLVLCRNVLIYFTPELQKRVLQVFAYSLRDGGYLVLGKAETVTPLASAFVPTDAQLKIYQRQGARAPLATEDFQTPSPVGAPTLHPRPPMRVQPPTSSSPNVARRARPQTSTERLGDLMFNLPVGIVVLDRHYDIQIINNMALRLFAIRRPAIGEDLLHLAENVPTRELRDLIDTALRGQQPPPISAILASSSETGETQHLQIAAYPQPSRETGAPIAQVLLQVSDVTARIQEQQARNQLEQQQAETLRTQTVASDVVAARLNAEIEQREQKIHQLTTVNGELRDANQELTAANLELRQASEESQVAIEELQASSEEIETLNEELQASNEELETLNEELQATVEELNTANDDMEARTRDLQSVATTLEDQRHASETERARLTAIVASMGDAVLVVASTGEHILMNREYERIFGTNDFAPEDENGQPLPPELGPQRRASRGESFSMVFGHTGANGIRRRFEANGQPIVRDGVGEGGVVIFRDVTERGGKHR